MEGGGLVEAQARVTRTRVTILVVLICLGVIGTVLAVGTRDSTANSPAGSPLSGQGSPVGGSPSAGRVLPSAWSRHSRSRRGR